MLICLYICIWRRSVVGVRLGRQLQLAPIPSAQLRLSHLQTKYTRKYKHKYKHICAYLYIYKHKYTSWNQEQETHSVFSASTSPGTVLVFLQTKYKYIYYIYKSLKPREGSLLDFPMCNADLFFHLFKS